MVQERALARWFDRHPVAYARIDVTTRILARLAAAAVGGLIPLTAWSSAFGPSAVTLATLLAAPLILIRLIVWMASPEAPHPGQPLTGEDPD